MLLGNLTLAVSGRHPNVSFQFEQNRKRAAVTSTALLGSVTLLGESPSLLRSLLLAVREIELPQQFL